MRVLLVAAVTIGLGCASTAPPTETPEASALVEKAYEHLDAQEQAKAYELFLQAAEMGSPAAQGVLGTMYYWGDGLVPQSDEQAAYWFRLAVDQEDAHPAAQYYMGLLYLEGRGVPRNDAEGLRLMTEAAERGNHYAEYRLGSIYQDGEITPRNLETALHWYQRAAEHGDPYGQYMVSYTYAEGVWGQKRDWNLAREWVAESAEQDYAPAQLKLGEFFETGIGGPQNDAEALKWYFLALDGQDRPDALTLRDRMTVQARIRRVTKRAGPEVLQEARRAASRWRLSDHGCRLSGPCD